MYKLHVTLEIADLSVPGDNADRIACARAAMFLQDMHLVIDGKQRWDGIPITVSLVRDGDRSSANLLALSTDGQHYQHHKVPITDVIS